MEKKRAGLRHELCLGHASARRIAYNPAQQRIEVLSPQMGAQQRTVISVNLMHCALIADFIQCEPQIYNRFEPPEYWLSVLFILFLGRVDCSGLPDNLLAPAEGLGRAVNIQTLQAFEKRIGGEALTQARCHLFFDGLAQSLAEKAKAERLSVAGRWAPSFIDALVVALPYGVTVPWLMRPILSGLLRWLAVRAMAFKLDQPERPAFFSSSGCYAAGRVVSISLACQGILSLASQARLPGVAPEGSRMGLG